jgi:hypothetical protein
MLSSGPLGESVSSWIDKWSSDVLVDHWENIH